ncbi:hypothetical protein ACQ86N_37925 [Puia sp. P3]|uniref:hypothetical protein n=1 Tax=Puia sp. P3 TaxID=3423952 RepID=UPI003D66982E
MSSSGFTAISGAPELSGRKPGFRGLYFLLAVWLLLLGILSATGFFADFSKLPPRMAFAPLVPLPIVLWFARSTTGKYLICHVRPQWMVYLQSFRILVELGLWALVRNGVLPVQLSFEGRNFDVLVGLLAIPVGYFVFVRKSLPSWTVLVYNIFGLLMLVNVVTIAFLSMPTPLRKFPGQPDAGILAHFPLIYLPGLLVPLAYSLHIFSIRQWAAARRR